MVYLVLILHLFLQWNDALLYWMCHVLFVHSLLDDSLGCLYFFFLAIMKNPAMNIHVQGFMWANVFLSLGYISRSGLSGLYMLKRVHLSTC